MDDLFDFSKPTERILISGGHVNGRVKPDNAYAPVPSKSSRSSGSSAYAYNYKHEEEKRILQVRFIIN